MIYWTNLKRGVPQVTALIDGVHSIGQCWPNKWTVEIDGVDKLWTPLLLQTPGRLSFGKNGKHKILLIYNIDNRLSWVSFSFSILLFETYGLRTPSQRRQRVSKQYWIWWASHSITFFELLLFLGFYWEKRIAFFLILLLSWYMFIISWSCS